MTRLRQLQMLRDYNPLMFSHTEPTLVTDPAIVDVLEELRRREPIFHRPELGTTRADFEDMMTPDFWEVGASGRRVARPGNLLLRLDFQKGAPSRLLLAGWEFSFVLRRIFAAEAQSATTLRMRASLSSPSPCSSCSLRRPCLISDPNTRGSTE
jgi:hypothetical protein